MRPGRHQPVLHEGADDVATSCYCGRGRRVWRIYSAYHIIATSKLGEGIGVAGYRIDRQLADFGQHVRGWRMVLGLTAQQVAERADITRDTLRKIESGNANVGFNNVAQVLRALGLLDQVVSTVDPLNSDLGRLRAGSLAKKRAR